MEQQSHTRRWVIVLAIAALLAVAGRCSGEVNIEPTQTLRLSTVAR